MPAPVSLPSNDAATSNESAGQIASVRRGAPRCGATAACRAIGATLKGRTGDPDVTCWQSAFGSTQQSYQYIPGRNAAHNGAWLIAAAGVINFARGHARQANSSALCAPDRAVAIPHCDRCAGESETGR